MHFPKKTELKASKQYITTTWQDQATKHAQKYAQLILLNFTNYVLDKD